MALSPHELTVHQQKVDRRAVELEVMTPSPTTTGRGLLAEKSLTLKSPVHKIAEHEHAAAVAWGSRQ